MCAKQGGEQQQQQQQAHLRRSELSSNTTIKFHYFILQTHRAIHYSWLVTITQKHGRETEGARGTLYAVTYRVAQK